MLGAFFVLRNYRVAPQKSNLAHLHAILCSGGFAICERLAQYREAEGYWAHLPVQPFAGLAEYRRFYNVPPYTRPQVFLRATNPRPFVCTKQASPSHAGQVPAVAPRTRLKSYGWLRATLVPSPLCLCAESLHQ